MAEQDADRSQRTEQPTDKRLKDARERGQVPRSRELGMALVMLAGAACLLAARPFFGSRLSLVLERNLALDRRQIFDPAVLPEMLGRALAAGLYMLSPLALTVVVAALAGTLAFGGWAFSLKAVQPKLERLDPVAGLRRVFGLNGLNELGKALAKFAFVGVVATLLLWHLAAELLELGRVSIDSALFRAARLTALCFAGLSAVLLVIAAIDVPLQWLLHRRRLKMTKQEVKDELRDTEGKPEVKSRVRSLQQEVAARRMMEEVPRADVVAVNPSHYAVALRYDAKRMRAPKVVAKGIDLVALNIRRVAEAHGVPIFEHRPLAQALYHSAALGAEIPERLYMAVAQVLSYVYQLKNAPPRRKRDVAKPDVAVDPDLLVPRRRRGPEAQATP